MITKGTTYGEIDIQHPTTSDYYTIHIRIDYVNEDDTYDTQGSLDWDYEIEWVEDEDGNGLEIVRNNLSFGDALGKQGTFFISYARDPRITEVMLQLPVRSP